MDSHSVKECVVVPNLYIFVDVAEWSNLVVVTQLCFRVNKCKGAYIIHLFLTSIFFLLVFNYLSRKRSLRNHMVSDKDVSLH